MPLIQGNGEGPFSMEALKDLYFYDPSEMDGDPIESDVEFGLNSDEELDLSDEEEENTSHRSFQTIRHSKNIIQDFVGYYDTGVLNQQDTIEGIKWELNRHIATPAGIATRPKSHIKPEFSKNKFRNEIESFLAFLPLEFWVYHLLQTNKKVEDEMILEGKSTFYGSKWKPITINELMIFYAILMQMSCRPSPGKNFVDCWKYKQEWFTNCNHMTVSRFKIIKAALHWNDDNFSSNTKDTLYKIRPLLNILSSTLGHYIEVGDSVALDETCIGVRSKYAKAMTYYNTAKPKGKHHLKFHTLCENDNWNAIYFKMCHRSTYKGEKNNDDDDNFSDLDDENVKKPNQKKRAIVRRNRKN